MCVCTHLPTSPLQRLWSGEWPETFLTPNGDQHTWVSCNDVLLRDEESFPALLTWLSCISVVFLLVSGFLLLSSCWQLAEQFL